MIIMRQEQPKQYCKRAVGCIPAYLNNGKFDKVISNVQ